jgi:hypothetical protein
MIQKVYYAKLAKDLTMHSTLVKTRLIPTLSLLLLLSASCAPSVVPAEAEATAAQPILVEPSATPNSQPEGTPLPTDTPSILVTQTAAPAPLPAATSRGPELHATDPSTVSLASGQVQLVEFFRFT